MVTWWLMGQEERRDSLTGINMAKGEGSLKLQKNSSLKQKSMRMTKSESVVQTQNNSSLTEAVVMKTSEGSLLSAGRRQSYSKIVSFNGHGKKAVSSEELNESLPLPGTVVTDNEPLL